MKKVKVSFDGRNNNQIWDIDELNDVGEPHLVISRSDRQLKVNFESEEEKKRFGAHIGLCRGWFNEYGPKKEMIYLTAFGK